MKFSVRRILWTDWPSLAATIGIPVIWAIQLMVPAGSRTDVVPLALPVVVSVALAAIVLWRVGRVARLFAKGRSAAGVVTGLSILRDRGRLEFSFEFAGQRIETWTPIHKNRAVLALRVGAAVEILFDAAQPKRAIVKCLYE